MLSPYCTSQVVAAPLVSTLPVTVAVVVPTLTAGPVTTLAGGGPLVLRVWSAPVALPDPFSAASR